MQVNHLLPSDAQLALLAMHYLDDITVNDQWAVPAAADGRNVIDTRTAANAANPDYQAINEAGRTELHRQARAIGRYYFIEGRTTYEVQRKVGHEVEYLLSMLIWQRRGVKFRPIDLPVIIDNVIREELRGRATSSHQSV